MVEAALDAADASLDEPEEQSQEQEQPEEISGYIDPKLVNKVLGTNMPKLCNIYYPQGKKLGDRWAMADHTGAPGESLQIKLVGPKAGHWVNLAAAPPDEEKNKRGKFIQLLMLSRNWTF